jgi:hypothetical protein
VIHFFFPRCNARAIFLVYLKRTNVFSLLPQFGRPHVLYAPHAPTWAGPTWAVALIPSHLHLARMCFNFPQAWPPPSSRRTQNRMSVPWPLPLRRRRHSPWRTAPRRNPWPPPPLCRRRRSDPASPPAAPTRLEPLPHSLWWCPQLNSAETLGSPLGGVHRGR